MFGLGMSLPSIPQIPLPPANSMPQNFGLELANAIIMPAYVKLNYLNSSYRALA